jgi:GTP-binding protein
VRWRHLKGKQFSGAAGGNGGRGGDVFVRAVRDLNILSRHKSVKKFAAGKGGDGQADSRHGRNGRDLSIDLPIGSVVTNISTGRTVELLADGQTELILHGGSGGLGNEYFKASTNVRPGQSTRGRHGEEADFTVELNLIADAGLVGLPNAGKSSLLNALTNAGAKVGSYAFTTLDPDLGAIRGYVIADIPGLIEGASEGKGLGHKFLRHIKRTKMILHLVSLDNEDIESAYLVIRRELERYGHGLPEKRETVILTKSDLVGAEAVRAARDILKKRNTDILEVTILDDRSVKKLAEAIVRRLQKE